MIIAITGATGLIGKAFIKKYEKKYKIVAISRRKDEPGYVYSDFSYASLNEIFRKVDSLIHLAGERLHKLESTDEEADLDKKVLMAAKNAGLKNIVYASSRGVYGNSHSPWDESNKIAPNNLYALKKAQSELLCNYLNEQHDMKIKCLRIAQVLSENEYTGSMIRVFLDRASKSENLHVSATGIVREYIYLTDLIEGINKAISNSNKFGVFNLGSGRGVSILEIAETIAEVFNNGCEVIVDDELVELHENSLMKVDLFKTTFNWSPRFTFKSAIEDIKRNILGE